MSEFYLSYPGGTDGGDSFDGGFDYDVDEIQEALTAGESIDISGLEQAGYLGKYVFLPEVMGFGPALILIALLMALWYVVVTWNEDTNKLIVPM